MMQSEERNLTIILFIVFCMVGFLLAMVSRGFSHGAAEWINSAGHKNKDGQLCCGMNDCDPFPAENVFQDQNGFKLRYAWDDQPREEVIQLSEIKTSIDRQYWRCHYDNGNTRCFFAPPGET